MRKIVEVLSSQDVNNHGREKEDLDVFKKLQSRALAKKEPAPEIVEEPQQSKFIALNKRYGTVRNLL